jgi:antitoxin FitA
MASITIRNLDEDLKKRLRVRSAQHGRSMEEEARDILRNTLATDVPTPSNLAESVRRRFRTLGDVELAIPTREPMREPPGFGQ